MAVSEFRLRHNLAAVLRARAMTAAELSRKTGVAKQVLSDWMAGVQPRKLEQLYLVAMTLGVSMEQLCFGESGADFGSKVRSSGVAVGQAGDSSELQELRGRYEIYVRRL